MKVASYLEILVPCVGISFPCAILLSIVTTLSVISLSSAQGKPETLISYCYGIPHVTLLTDTETVFQINPYIGESTIIYMGTC